MSRNIGKAGAARRLAACLPEHLTNALGHRVDEDSRLRQAWRARIPEPLASHVRPVRYAAGTLFVHVDTSAWASRLRHQQPALVSALKGVPLFRDLVDFRFRVVPLEAPAPRAAVKPTPSRLSAKAAKTVADAARTVSNPDLRAALERLAESASGSTTRKRS